MNVLYVSGTPLAGVCELMARVMNTYCKPEFSARVLNGGPGRHEWYLRPPKELVPTYVLNNKNHVAACLEWADVIHCMANVGLQSPQFWRFDRQSLLKKKVWVHQWHGAQIWPLEKVWKPEDYKYLKFIHIGQGWMETQKDFFEPFIKDHGLKVCPNLITADDPLHRPLNWDARLDRTCFAPSQKRESAVNRKGIPEFHKEIRGYRFELISFQPFELCLKKKQQCKLGVDEFVTPMYHRSGLEFLSQGTACICSYSDFAKRDLLEATGADEMPFIQCTKDTFREKLDWFWKELDEMDRMELGVKARAWIDLYYHPRVLIRKHIDVYES